MSVFENIFPRKTKKYSSDNTIFSFGSFEDRIYGKLILNSDGTISGYENPHENRWEYVDEELRFIDVEGTITSRFNEVGNRLFVGKSEINNTNLYLSPLLFLGQSLSTQFHGGFLVNTIPKAGTYFLEAALSAMGSKSVRLHLSGEDIVDDFRQLKDEEIHVNPERVRLFCPNHLIASLLKGRTAVGHIQYPHILDQFSEHSVFIFNIKRNLRDVLVSMYRFKQNKVLSKGGLDDSWRAVSDNARFISFLNYFADKDLCHIRLVAEMMTKEIPGVSLSYEDMCSGKLSEDAQIKLEKFKPGLSKDLISALNKEYGKSNPTFSGKKSSWQDYWNDDIEIWFVTSGFKELNLKLGYE